MNSTTEMHSTWTRHYLTWLCTTNSQKVQFMENVPKKLKEYHLWYKLLLCIQQISSLACTQSHPNFKNFHLDHVYV